MSITYRQLQGQGEGSAEAPRPPEGTPPNAAAASSRAAPRGSAALTQKVEKLTAQLQTQRQETQHLTTERRKLERLAERLKQTVTSQRDALQELRQQARKTPSPPPPDAATLVELERLRARAQMLEDDAHNTTRLLEAAKQEVDRHRQALATTAAPSPSGEPAPQSTQLATQLRDSRADADRTHAALALTRAELAAERDARRQREDELVQNLRQARAHLEAATQRVARQQQERVDLLLASAAIQAAARKREETLAEQLAAAAHTDEATWYLDVGNGQVLGPVREGDLRQWAGDCRVAPEHRVSRDKQTWIPARDVPGLRLEWMVELSDGGRYGPLNIFAIPQLITDGSVRPDATLTHARSGYTCSARDAGVAELLTLREALHRQQAELAALRADLEAARRPAAPHPVPTPGTPAPPRSVRAIALRHGTPRF